MDEKWRKKTEEELREELKEEYYRSHAKPEEEKRPITRNEKILIAFIVFVLITTIISIIKFNDSIIVRDLKKRTKYEDVKKKEREVAYKDTKDNLVLDCSCNKLIIRQNKSNDNLILKGNDCYPVSNKNNIVKFFELSKTSIVVYLPAHIKNLTVDLADGDIILEDIKLDNLEIKQNKSVGDFKLDNCDIRKVSFESQCANTFLTNNSKIGYIKLISERSVMMAVQKSKIEKIDFDVKQYNTQLVFEKCNVRKIVAPKYQGKINEKGFDVEVKGAIQSGNIDII